MDAGSWGTVELVEDDVGSWCAVVLVVEPGSWWTVVLVLDAVSWPGSFAVPYWWPPRASTSLSTPW
jgi:hypothetical protein